MSPLQPAVIQGGMELRCCPAVRQCGSGKGSARGGVRHRAHVALARRLQDGDPGDHSAARWPRSPTSRWRSGARPIPPRRRSARPGSPAPARPKLKVRQNRIGQELAVLGNFAEVWLAKARAMHGVVAVAPSWEKAQTATGAGGPGRSSPESLRPRALACRARSPAADRPRRGAGRGRAPSTSTARTSRCAWRRTSTACSCHSLLPLGSPSSSRSYRAPCWPRGSRATRSCGPTASCSRGQSRAATTRRCAVGLLRRRRSARVRSARPVRPHSSRRHWPALLAGRLSRHAGAGGGGAGRRSVRRPGRHAVRA